MSLATKQNVPFEVARDFYYMVYERDPKLTGYQWIDRI